MKYYSLQHLKYQGFSDAIDIENVFKIKWVPETTHIRQDWPPCLMSSMTMGVTTLGSRSNTLNTFSKCVIVLFCLVG